VARRRRHVVAGTPHLGARQEIFTVTSAALIAATLLVLVMGTSPRPAVRGRLVPAVVV
jgi:hypothetical protein